MSNVATNTRIGTKLELTLESRAGRSPFALLARRMYNLGYTIRDAALMQAHMDELVRAGVPQATIEVPPMVFPISHWAITTATEVPSQEDKTSGEIEFVIIQDGGVRYLGVGSDHTDRVLEIDHMGWSKQVCANVLAPTIWPLDEVRDHWDALELTCHVVDRGGRRLYQRATGGQFWTGDEMLDGLARKLRDPLGDAIVFSGTVVTEGAEIAYAQQWEIRLNDPVLGRSIEHTYTVPVLGDAFNELVRGDRTRRDRG